MLSSSVVESGSRRINHLVTRHSVYFLLLSSSAVEQVTVNHLVAGSIPAWAAIIKALSVKHLGLFCAHLPLCDT